MNIHNDNKINLFVNSERTDAGLYTYMLIYYIFVIK